MVVCKIQSVCHYIITVMVISLQWCYKLSMSSYELDVKWVVTL